VCTAPGLVGLSVVSGTEGTDTPLSVELQEAPAGYSYELVLTPETGESTVLSCAHVEADPPVCDVTVPGSLPAGSYAASMRVTASGVTYETSSSAAAFTQGP
jgi:hypothetical protein